MRILNAIAAVAVVVGFAAPAFAACAGHDKTAQTSTPTTTAEAPQTPRPGSGDGS